MALSFTTLVRNARQDSITTYAGSGALIRIYDGSAPASANAALSGNTLLAELTCGATIAPAASGAVLTFSSITQDSSANATGTATFFRLYKSDGTTVVAQGTVSTSGADLNITTTSVVTGVAVQITSLAWTDGNP